MNRVRRVHYVLSTHWDREWYQTFQNYRYQLVELFDRLLGGYSDGTLQGPFQTDGQAILLEDYLEVRPERRGEIEQRVKEGKFAIGPWYVLPDEFLVSGESLIRNLRMGRDVARSLGGRPSNAGFVCDLFGHNSQMPQIFKGFGIQGGFVWRGTNVPHSRNLIWTGADGTELPCYRFGRIGYCDYAIFARRIHRHELPFDAKQLATDTETYIEQEAKKSEVDPILMFDGADHQDWDRRTYAVLAEKMNESGREYPIAHTSLDDYLAEMLPQADRIQTRLTGELRDAGTSAPGEDEQMLIPGVASSRVGIKQANAECQALLCRWAEPTSAFAHTLFGIDVASGFLDLAWRWLLKNHPHDSICGCSIDQVHEDMKFRFSQCRQIADRVTREATLRIAASIQGELGDHELRVVVFNPLPRAIDETAELTLEIPTDWPMFNEFFGFEPKPAFLVYDADNTEIPYQRLAQRMNRNHYRIHPFKFTYGYQANEVDVSLPLRIPAMGYTTLTVRRGEPGTPTRHPAVRTLAVSHRTLENEFLRVTVEPNGTLTLHDKRTGETYSDLLTFEEAADIGDGWYHGVAVNDQVFTSCAGKSDVALVHNGPMLATLRIRTVMSVPSRFDFCAMTRAPQFTDLIIESFVSVRPHTDRVEVRTVVRNTVEDHRIRVLFPSGAQSDEFFTDTPFDVVQRTIPLRENNHLYRELEIETRPQQSFTAVHDDRRGLAVVSSGLMESAVQDLPARPIALTLFRGTRRTVMTNGEPGGLLPGDLEFRYWIVPLTGAPDMARLTELGQRIASGFRTVQAVAPDVENYRQETSVPPQASFFRLTGPAVATSACRVEEATEIRVFNPTTETVRAQIIFLEYLPESSRPRKAIAVDFESRPLDTPLEYENGTVSLGLGPKKIATIRLV